MCLLAAQVIVSSRFLLRLTVLIDTQYGAGTECGVGWILPSSPSFSLPIWTQPKFLFSQLGVWTWCPETVYWALQGSNQSTKAKSICCEVSVRINHHSLHQFPFPPLTPAVCTFSFEESNTLCKLLRFALRWSAPWFSSTFDFISLYV